MGNIGNSMDEKRKNRYNDKITSLTEYINLLDDWLKQSSLKDIKESGKIDRLFAIYHAFQLTLEIIIDLSSMTVKDLKLNPGDNYLNLEKIFRKSIITQPLLSDLKKLIGLRNRIVHDYNGLNDELAWESIEQNLPSIIKFKEMIESWLKNQ